MALRDVVSTYTLFSNWNGFDAVVSLTLEQAGKWARYRHQFDRPLGEFDLVKENVAKMSAYLYATDAMLAAFGQGGVSVPMGLGRVADVSGKMTYTKDGRISL